MNAHQRGVVSNKGGCRMNVKFPKPLPERQVFGGGKPRTFKKEDQVVHPRSVQPLELLIIKRARQIQPLNQRPYPRRDRSYSRCSFTHQRDL